ncbi:hypothetical protein AJ80_01345 [Polytolypa hystricis UAMH7299]|uniref:Small ribosomal subunit protein uS5m n=1 Tax=Polytolypa hystricis (strain UAMH7299) TaxID=1447883 RepID=A0A2B7Z0W5_POLH7|nr:hypothetical protein AJ80_01345 [Polytolypa hystricis UAMH7299]
MSVARPAARCLFCSFSRRAVTTAVPRRQFHASIIQQADRKPKHVNIKVSELSSFQDLKTTHFQPYTAEEKARFAEEYTPAQIAAIEAGEKSIDPEDIAKQFAQRDDPWAFKYLDDFSTIEPVVDHHIRAPVTNTDPYMRDKTEAEFVEDLAQFIENSPEDLKSADILRFLDDVPLTTGSIDAERNQNSALVPDICQPGETLDTMGERLPSPAAIREADAAVKEAPTPALEKLMQVTGLDEKEIRGLRVRSLVMHSVVNQTRLGKIRKTYVLSIAGNGKGLLGIGEGKSEEGSEAIIQSQYRAIRNMQPVLRYEGRTIYGDVKGKVGAVELELMHRPAGFGLRCQLYIWEMCRAAGIKDLAARSTRSRNPMNTVKATYEALLSQKHPEDIARARGKKLVDVRKVYYAGNLSSV